jgi:hypothetical protein
MPLVAEIAKDDPQLILLRPLRVDLRPHLGDGASHCDQTVLFETGIDTRQPRPPIPRLQIDPAHYEGSAE